MKGGVRFESWVEEDAEKRKEALRRINAFVRGVDARKRRVLTKDVSRDGVRGSGGDLAGEEARRCEDSARADKEEQEEGAGGRVRKKAGGKRPK